MARLLVWDPGECEPREHGLAHVTTTFGRGKANTVVLLGDGSASLRHASLARTPAGYVLRDEGSTNGTWVNGERIEERLLVAGDQIQIGGTVILFED
jgi:pSer/pThr/pTyr-binding forkhead associated (FHA) protein